VLAHPSEPGAQRYAERLIADVGGNRHLGEEHRHPGRQGRFRADVLRGVQHRVQVSTGLQPGLEGGIAQEFGGAEATLGEHRGRIEEHPGHLPGILTEGHGIKRIPSCGGGADADQVAGRET
jgi:hypothetical protein